MSPESLLQVIVLLLVFLMLHGFQIRRVEIVVLVWHNFLGKLVFLKLSIIKINIPMKRQVVDIQRDFLDKSISSTLIKGKFSKALSARHASLEGVCQLYSEVFGNILFEWFEDKGAENYPTTDIVEHVLSTMSSLCDEESHLLSQFAKNEMLFENLLYITHLWQGLKIQSSREQRKIGNPVISHDAFDTVVYILHGILEDKQNLKAAEFMISNRSKMKLYLFSLCKSIDTEEYYPTQELCLEIVIKLYAHFLKKSAEFAAVRHYS